MFSKKECIIENGQFSYILHVDGHGISFQGAYAADYFRQHYQKLGYKVLEIKTFKTAAEMDINPW